MKKKIAEGTLEAEELQGPVKQVKETNYGVVARNDSYVPGMLSEHSFENSVKNFIREGILTEAFHFTRNGLEAHYRYTAEGRIDSIVSYKEDGSVKSTSQYIYNEAGDPVESVDNTQQEHTADLWLTRWVYDERGFCTEYITTRNDILSSRQTYRHDDEGNVIEQFIYDKSNALEHRLEKVYNARGQRVDEKDYNREGVLTKHTIIHYDGPDGDCSGITTDGVYEAYSSSFSDRFQETEHDHHGNWTARTEYDSDDWEEGDKPEYFAFRQFTYYGEPSENTTLSIENTIYDMAAKHHPIPQAPQHNGLSPEQWRWVAEGATEYEPFSIYRYYTAIQGFFPSCMSISSYEVDLWSLRQHLLQQFGAAEIWIKVRGGGNIYSEIYERYILAFPGRSYMLEADDIQYISSYHYSFAGIPANDSMGLGNYIQTGKLRLYYPAASFGDRDKDFEDELDNIISSFRVKKKMEIPQISMVTVLGNSFTLKTYHTKDDFEIADLDLHYGNGFEQFHNGLMEKFSGTTQGLFLFHGEPGTGKTFYVRHLLRKMQESKKVVIYMPPNMVDHLAEPSFMTFISDQVATFKGAGKSCIMLIEDAEPLLVARDANIRIQGITNLLNMTDGLLNDMLGLQIICTFNVPLKELDKALLRPGRLIARKEFKALPEFEANVLAHSLGIKHVFKRPATLSEIYAKAPDKEMLTHDE